MTITLSLCPRQSFFLHLQPPLNRTVFLRTGGLGVLKGDGNEDDNEGKGYYDDIDTIEDENDASLIKQDNTSLRSSSYHVSAGQSCDARSQSATISARPLSSAPASASASTSSTGSVSSSDTGGRKPNKPCDVCLVNLGGCLEECPVDQLCILAIIVNIRRASLQRVSDLQTWLPTRLGR